MKIKSAKKLGAKFHYKWSTHQPVTNTMLEVLDNYTKLYEIEEHSLSELETDNKYCNNVTISNEIKDILIFQKSKEYLKNYEKDLLINAQNDNNFEIY